VLLTTCRGEVQGLASRRRSVNQYRGVDPPYRCARSSLRVLTDDDDGVPSGHDQEVSTSR
jgi:hypothetical protein